jgi:hypothetical protein
MDMRADERGSVELLHAWCYPHALNRECVGRACVHAPATDSSAVPRCAMADPAFDALLEHKICSVLLDESEHSKERAVSGSGMAVSNSRPSFVFSPELPRIGIGFEFLKSLSPRPQASYGKRVRHRLDVDGPNTATLSCKKRRLRSELITSRLSQPYSQPATHILNREGMKSGDKRFLKMATSIDIARRVAYLHATSILRFSLMNRLRRRLGLGPPTAQSSEESHSITDDDDDDDTNVPRDQKKNLNWTSKAPLGPQSLQAASGGKYIRPSRAMGAAICSAVGPSPLGSGQNSLSKTQGCRVSKPAGLPLPGVDLAAAQVRISPIIHPARSPERHSERPVFDDAEEDSFAFLHLDDEAFADSSDGDSVYSDFGVIFGDGASGSDVRTVEDHSYEEYLDELDGISWVSR